MIYLFAVIGIVSSLVFIKKKNTYKKKKEGNTVGFLICKNILDFLLPFTLVSIFFCFFDVALFLFAKSDFINIKTLLLIENYFRIAAIVFGPLKLGFIEILVFIIILFIFSFFQILFIVRLKKYLLKGFNTYQRWTTRIYFILMFLASFTFFSNEISSPIHRVSLRINEVRHGYAMTKNKIEKIVDEELSHKIIDRTVKSMPRSYTTHLNLLAEMPVKVENLKIRYTSFLNDEKVRIGEAEEAIRENNKKRVIVNTALKNIQKSSNKINLKQVKRSSDSNSKIPPEITMGTIIKVNKKIDEYAKLMSSKRKNILPEESGRELTSHLLKSGAWSGLRPLLLPVFNEYPILEPIAKAIANIAGDISSLPIQDAKNSVSLKLFSNPDTNIGNTITDSIKTITERNIPNAIDKADDSLYLSTKLLEAQSSLILMANRVMDHHLIQKEADNRISLLSSENEESRINSANWLYSHRLDISSKQNSRIKDLMDNGNKSWEIKVGERWEGNYCYKTFRNVSISDYAKVAVTGELPSGGDTRTIGYTFTRTYI